MTLKLSIGKKLYLVFTLFLVPVVYLLYSLIAEKHIAIDFAAKEEVGNQYISVAHEVQFKLHRYLRLAGAGGANTGDVARARDELAKALADAADAETRLGDGMDSAEFARTLADQGKRITAGSPLQGEALGKAGGDALTTLRSLIGRIGDQSNLILDPDLDSYYMMDLILLKFPDLVDRLAAITDLAASVAAKGSLDAADRTEFLLQQGGLVATIDGVAASVASGYRGNPDGSLKANLDATYLATKRALDESKAGLTAAILDKEGKGADAKALFELEARALAATHRLWEVAGAELERLLEIRIGGFYTRMWLTLAITAVLFGVAAAIGGVTVVRGIVRPLTVMTAVMGELAGGNTAVAIPHTGKVDEVGDMARAVVVFKDNMIRADELAEAQRAEQASKEQRSENLEEWVAVFDVTVSTVIQGLTLSAERMQHDASALAANAEETNRQAIAVAAAADQASTNVQTVAAAAQELTASIAEIARQVSDSACISATAVQQAGHTNDTVSGLSEAAEKIGEVVGLINNIASQTNLLALNATIEAARAGEAGKGFAVVANEVKNLANQTAQATDDIQQQVARIQAVAEAAVGAIHEIGQTIERMNDITTSIASAVEEQGAATHEIARNVVQASSGTTEVSQNIVNVTKAAGETGAMAGDALIAAGELTEQAESLRREVDSFISRVRLS